MVQCLLVLGMHRSGTSALAGSLRTLGVHLGERLMEPRPGENQSGYFEDLEIYEAHKRLLDELGFSWDDPRPLSLDAFPEGVLNSHRADMTRLLRERFADRTLWAVKDPRLSLLVPWWQEILSEINLTPGFVIVYRHPAEVALSLASRNAFSVEKSASLWLNHNLAAEASTRGRPRVFVSFDELLGHPVETLGRVAEGLGVDWPRAPGKVAEELREFLVPSLRNHRAASITNPDFGRFARWVLPLFEELEAARLGETLALERFADAARDEVGAAKEVVDSLWVEHSAGMSASLRGEIRDLAQRVKVLADGTENRLETLNDRADAQDHERSLERKAMAGLAEQVDERTQWLGAQEEEVKGLRRLVESLEEQLSERTRWLQIQSRTLDALGEEVERLKRKDAGGGKGTGD